MPTLAIALLGTYAVTLDGCAVNVFAYDKVRGLLAYLAVERGRPHRREHLVTLFWPEQARRAGLQSLSQALYQLRRALPEADLQASLLRTDTQTVEFVAECELDVHRFVHLLGTCQTHTHVQMTTCATCIDRLEQAVALYCGDFLVGFSLPDSRDFEDWVLFQREQLHYRAIEALRNLTQAYLRCGEPAAAQAAARRWLTLDPWQEEAHCAAMRALDAGGQRQAALAQYETCRQILAAELAVDPGPETTAIYLRIRKGGEQLGAQRARNNLPAQLTPLIGRIGELRDIVERLQEPDCRLLSLVGPGGCGKTRLALAAAAQVGDAFCDGVFFLSLAAIEAIDGIVPEIARATGMVFSAHEDARRQLLTYLGTKQMLLVLDNFDHLAPGAPLLVEVLAAAPQVKILATSRARLNCVGEQVICVEGLALPAPELTLRGAKSDALGPDTLCALATVDAVALFLYHARRVRAPYAPDSADLMAIAQICRAVAGMPLAIVLAAAWMDLLPAPVLASQLLDDLAVDGNKAIDLLAADWLDLPARQRSMRAVFDQAWGLLSAPDQQMLAALSVLRGGFTHVAAHAIARATLRQLRTLVEKSWLHRSAENRYQIHELLRHYAAEKLMPELVMAVQARHCAYFAGALERWAVDLHGARQLAALSEIELDFENVQHAWNWAVAQADWDHAGAALDGICLFLDWRGRCQQGEDLCRQAVEALRPAVQCAPCAVGVRLQAWHGWFSLTLNHVDVAMAQLNSALVLAGDGKPDAGDELAARALALYVWGHAHYGTDQVEAGRAWAESLELYHRLGERWGEAQALIGLGMLGIDTGAYDAAQHRLEEGLALCQALGDQRSAAQILGYLSTIYATRGDLTRAENYCEQSVALRETLGDPLGAAESRLRMAGALVYAGQSTRAADLFVQAADASRAVGASNTYALGIHLLAWVNTNRGEYALATRQYQEAQAIWRERSHQHGLALSALSLGELALVQAEFKVAYSLLAEAGRGYAALKQRDELAITLAELARALLGLQREQEARLLVRQALAIAQSIGAFAPMLFALHAYALILAEAGKIAQALELHTIVGNHPYLSHAAWRQVDYDRYLRARVAQMPAAEQAAAIAHGSGTTIAAAAAAVLAELARGVDIPCLSDFEDFVDRQPVMWHTTG